MVNTLLLQCPINGKQVTMPMSYQW